MKVSVVIPTYSMDRYDDMVACAESVFDQTYDDIEVVIIVDGNDAVYDRAVEDFGDRDDVVIYGSAENAGPLSRGNMGVIQASGDIVAITDDDAYADPRWIEELVETYERHDAIAVGGKMDPEWVADKPEFLPEEFYFLIGVTHRGFQEEEGEVRNTFGANMSFKRNVYLELGGIKLNGIGPDEVQGRETEFCARMYEEYGEGVIYNPDAVVHHLIYDYRTEKRWLAERAFWQGYSKRGMEVWLEQSTESESQFLRRLLFEFVPRRVWRIVRTRSETEAQQLVWLFVLTAAVGAGYLYGLIRW